MNPTLKKIAFLDRDGTLIYEPPFARAADGTPTKTEIPCQIDRVEKLRILDGVIETLQRLLSSGYSLVMVTNQNGIGTAGFPQENFDAPQNLMLGIFEQNGILFEKIFVCPHMPEANCACRKPKTGLVDEWLAEQTIDRDKSFMCGDRETDRLFAQNLGVRFIETPTNSALTLPPDIIPRTASINRTTSETQISLELNLDGSGSYSIKTPIGFLNHMLELFTKHGNFDLRLTATGDVEKDDHHTIEDVAIVLGQAIAKALGTKRGIQRYGSQILPMDNVLCVSAVDLSGRFAFATNYEPQREKVNDFPTEMMRHFFESIAVNAMMNLHIQFLNPGNNEHHRLEAVFKSFARALRQALAIDSRAATTIPSTKGTI